MPDSAHNVTRRALPGWGLALFLTLTLAALSAFDGLGRFDYLIYDYLHRSLKHPADPEIVLVAIDDGSLQQLGTWPWPRTTHAQLLEQLPGARAIAFDVLFSEPDRYNSTEDHALAAAMRTRGNVVLPGVLDPASGALIPPTAELAQAAAGIGYINMQPDADGVARRVTPRSAPGVQHLSDIMLAVAKATPKHTFQDGQSALIRFAGPAGQFRMLPYADVLAGRVPATAWQDKLVIVGAWATGLGDNFATPVSQQGIDMAGMEVLANILQSRRAGLEITIWPTWATFCAGLVPVLLLLLALRRLSPRRGLYASAAAVLMTLLGSWLLLRFAHIWAPPGAALLVIGSSYPLWSWRSQELALRSLGQTLRLLRKEDQAFPEIPRRERPADQHLLDERIYELGQALERVRNLRAFLSNSLESTPDPTLVCDPDGTLRYVNRAARDHWERLGVPLPLDQAVLPSLHAAFPALTRDTLQAWMPAVAQTPTSLTTLESQDKRGSDWLLQHAKLTTPTQETTGFVIELTDISAIRTIERRREQALSFLSHDMRAPQNSILAQIDLRRQANDSAGEAQTLQRITGYARQTLELVDGFVNLSRAESAALQPHDTDLYDLLCECSDNFFSLAQGAALRITTTPPPAPVWLCVDASLLRRAIGNLLHNAIKFSPRDSQIDCSIHWDGQRGQWVIQIRDHGPGVPQEDLQRLFEPFTQNATGTAIRNPGTGLGLAFVLTVAQRHHGDAWASNAEDGGAIFHIGLPPSSDAEPTPT